MRSLQTKQPPLIKFTYQSSPNHQSPQHLHPSYYSLPKKVGQSTTKEKQKSINNQPEGTNPKLTTNNNESSHIKIVELAQSEQRRERRHKIFEEVGSLNRLSKSKQRNKSYTIFNGINHENTNKIKDLVFTKQSCKEQSVQTQNPTLTVKPENEQKISTFMQSAQKVSVPNPYVKPISLELPLQEPLQLSKYSSFHQNLSQNSVNTQRLQRELISKEKELTYLKLQLQRYQRCEKLTKQNESIYKRLVQKLALLTSTSTIQKDHRDHNLASTHKAKSILEPSETTRFHYPQTQRKDTSTKKEVLNSLQKLRNAFEQSDNPNIQILKEEQPQTNTLTFYKQTTKAMARNSARNPSSFKPCSNEDLNKKLQQSVRRYTTNVNFDDFPLKDKLSQMNRHLQNRYTLRNDSLAAGSRIQNSRYTSQSQRQVQRGRSISSHQQPSMIRYS